MHRPAPWRLAAAIITLLLAHHTHAQIDDPTSTGASHAWLVLPDRAADASVLVHAPPRRAVEGAAFEPSEPGTLRVARRLATAPRAIAARADDVFLLMPPAPGRPARVLALTAVPAPIGDFWSYEPRTRLRALPPLPERFTPEGIVGADPGPTLLGSIAGRPALVQLNEGAWAKVALPPGLGSGAVRAAPDARGRVQLVVFTPADATIWTQGATGWNASSLPAAISPDTLIALGASDSRLLVAQRDSDAVRLLSITSSGAETIAEVGEPFGDGPVAGAFQGDRAEVLVLAWEEAGENATPRVRLAEISTVTGQELYRGHAIRTLPVSATQFRVLAAALVALMGVVLLVVLKPAEEGVIVLPDGWALAEPGRRLAATMIDAIIAVFIVRLIFNVPLIEIVTLSGLMRPGGAWMAAPAMLMIGGAISTLGEWVFGRSPGKLATGCRVVRIRPVPVSGQAPARPTLGRTLVRNIIKWALPPVAALALVDPSARHRGDSISGLAVVVPVLDDPVASDDQP